MTEFLSEYAPSVESIIKKVGNHIVIGVPLGVAKPIGLLNELYTTVAKNPHLSLTIITGLTLARPNYTNQWAKRLAQPILDRILHDYADPLYEIARVKQQLPSNIKVIEFFLASGKFLKNSYVQQHYISSKYTSVAQDSLYYGLNVVAQQVASSPNHKTLSLSSNTDLFQDILDVLTQQGLMNKVAIVAEINTHMPFMLNSALVPIATFTHVINPSHHRAIFSLPREEMTAQDHMIGLYASTLIKDNGSLQLGIGSFCTAVSNALILRHTHNRVYQELLTHLKNYKQYQSLIEKVGGIQPFTHGIYANTEMLSDDYMHLLKHKIIKKRVYDHLGLQRLLNANQISEIIDEHFLEELIKHQIISKKLTAEDFIFLKKFGVINSLIKYQDGYLLLADGTQLEANLELKAVKDYILKHCLGSRLLSGKLIHAGFFLGSRELYQFLHEMPNEVAEQIAMSRISRTNSILWQPELAKAQRQHARFVNSAMMVTLSGSIVSDGLDNLQEVSGVGGQFDFVNMAHELPDARSIILCRSTRLVNKRLQSNIVWTYPNVTIPRYLRDIVITEYGIADCRSKTDADVIKTLLNICDSRFQNTLLKEAKVYGKIAEDYQIPQIHQHNFPHQYSEILQNPAYSSFFEKYPFGTDLTAEEIILSSCLMQIKNYSPWQFCKALIQGAFVLPVAGKFGKYLERMSLSQSPRTLLFKMILLGTLSKLKITN